MTQTVDAPVPRSYRGAPLTWLWPYRDRDGAELGYVARYDGPDGKEVIPFLRRNGTGWLAGAPEGFASLFGLDSLRPESTLPVLVCEGEKCAAALHSLGLPAVTSQGGSQSARRADWTPLSGVPRVAILPDRDTPGEAYARTVAEILRGLPTPPEISIARLPDLPEKGDVVDWLSARLPGWGGFGPVPREPGDGLLDELLEAIEDCATPFEAPGTVEAAPEAWEAPISLDAAVTPEWPRDTFPGPIQAFVDALSESTQTPIELPAAAVLGILSTATQGKFQVHVGADHYEPVQVWPCPVLESGSRKTSVFKAAIAPLAAYQRQERERMEPELAREASQRKTLQGRIDGLRSKAAKCDASGLQAAQDEIEALEGMLPAQRYAPQYWTNDCTTEILAVLMSRQQGCMAVLSDEAGLFDALAGRYSNSLNLDLYLQAHAGAPVIVDRISRDAIVLDRPALTVSLMAQPSVIRALGAKAEFRGRGLLARFLFIVPRDTLGTRTVDARPVPVEVRDAYHSTVKAILSLPWNQDKNGNPCANTLTLSREARALWEKFWLVMETQLRDGGTFSHLTDFGSKLPGAVARIAGILHVARHAHGEPWARPISLQDMTSAVEIGDALSRHALLAFDLVGSDPALDDARACLSWIRRTKAASFSKRDLHAGLKHRLKRTEAVDAALAVLSDRGYVRLRPAAITGERGRPAGPAYDVNPVAEDLQGGGTRSKSPGPSTPHRAASKQTSDAVPVYENRGKDPEA